MTLDRAYSYLALALRAGTAAALASAPALAPAAANAAGVAGFGPLTGSNGCLVAPGKQVTETQHCGPGKGLVGPNALAVSPDGANVYVTAGKGGGSIASSFGAIAILKREAQTGAITETGCISSDGTDGRDGASGACTAMPALLGADGVAVSPDGAAVYVTSSASGSVIAFARDPATGALTRIGCFQGILRPGSPCVEANVFPGSSEIVASPDGQALYIASPEMGAVSALTTSPLKAQSSASGPSVAEPPRTVASLFSAPFPTLANPCIGVNGLDGTCAVGVATQGLGDLALSPDGMQLYAVAPSSGAIDTFTRDATGAIAQSGCLKTDPPPGLCSASSLKDSPRRLAISPDGKSGYVIDSGPGTGRIDVLSRNSASGALSDSSCVDFLPPPPEKNEEGEEEEHESTPPGPCAHFPGLASANVLAIAGDGSAVYTFGNDSAAFFARDAASGKLTETSCASAEDKRCASVPALRGEKTATAVSTDGREVYFADSSANAVFAFTLGAAVLTPRALVSRFGIARVRVACPRGLPRACSGRVQLARVIVRRARHKRHSQARRHVERIFAGSSSRYTIAPGGRAIVSVVLSPATRRLLQERGRLRVAAVVAADPLAGGSGFGRHVLLRLHRGFPADVRRPPDRLGQRHRRGRLCALCVDDVRP